MNHHLKVLNSNASFINEAFGINQEKFTDTVQYISEKLIDHFYQHHFQKDGDQNCTFLDSLLESLQDEEAEKKIFTLENANAYFVFGMAFCRALDLAKEEIEDGYLQLNLAKIKKRLNVDKDKKVN